MSTTEPIVAPAETPAVSTTTETAAPAAAAPAPEVITSKPEDRRGTIREALNGKVSAAQAKRDVSGRMRDEVGRFTGTLTGKDGMNVVGGQVVGPAPIVNRPPLHPTYNKELEPHWNQAPPELLNRIIAREEEMKRGLEPLKSAQAQLNELMSEFQPYEQLLKNQNLTPRTAIAPLMRAHQLLSSGSPYEKAQAMQTMLRDYGVPLEHLTQLPPAQAAPQAQVLDPILSRIAQQVDALTASQQQQAEREVHSVIMEFAAKPGHEHFSAVEETMGELLASPGILGADTASLPPMDRLQRAYDAAIRLNPAIQAQIEAAKLAKPPEQIAPATQPKKPPTQLKGAPTGATTPLVDPKDRRAVIRNALSAIH